MNMKQSPLIYDQFMSEAKIGVIRRVLEIVANEGIHDNHHFYIAFITSYTGVEIPISMRKQYPDEITIVLQHEFKNLLVDKNSFSVELKFSSNFYNVVVPYKSIKFFADPSQDFILEFPLNKSNIEHGLSHSKVEKNNAGNEKVIDLLRFKSEKDK